MPSSWAWRHLGTGPLGLSPDPDPPTPGGVLSPEPGELEPAQPGSGAPAAGGGADGVRGLLRILLRLCPGELLPGGGSAAVTGGG